ncbi:hypothetical protein ACFVRU_60525, partial [Streptomyces sp. NPDC057927]
SGSMSPMSVLTRDEAQTRAQLLDVHHYGIALCVSTPAVRGSQIAFDTWKETLDAGYRSHRMT